jgi:hypothetical protein
VVNEEERVKGLLFSQMEPPPGWEDDFTDWYENEHIPARMALPGFASAKRYRAIEGQPAYLACYFLDDLAVLETPDYQRLKSDPSERTARMLSSVNGFTRYTCREISDTGPVDEEPTVLSAVAFSVPAEGEEEFEGWYADEHIPMLMAADGWLRVRRYRTLPGHDGPPWTHLALHELRDESAMKSPERDRARSTDRRREIGRHEWFAGSGRWLYRQIHSAVAQHAGTTTD